MLRNNSADRDSRQATQINIWLEATELHNLTCKFIIEHFLHLSFHCAKCTSKWKLVWKKYFVILSILLWGSGGTAQILIWGSSDWSAIHFELLSEFKAPNQRLIAILTVCIPGYVFREVKWPGIAPKYVVSIGDAVAMFLWFPWARFPLN
jgi:hypothetical protein